MNTKISNELLLKNLAITIAEHPRYTLNELAESAGISKATLYRFCGTRENLEELIAMETRKCIEFIIEVAKKQYSEYEIAIQEIMQIHFEYKEFLVFAREIQLCVEHDYVNQYITVMDEFFLNGKKQGFFKMEFEVATLTELFIAIFSGIINAERIGRIPSALSLKIFKESFLTGVEEMSR